MDRRTFLYTGAVLIGTPPLAACRPWMKKELAPETGPSPHQRATLAAMAETFIPSSDSSPGARESGAIELIVDPAFPVAGYISELVGDLDDWCYVRHFSAFVDLSPSKREQALEERLGHRGRLIASWYKPVYEGVLALTKLSFFGGLGHAIGTTFTGFPGESTGYAADSAAGVYRGDGAAVIVAGPGAVSSLWVTALVKGERPRVLRLTGPDGRSHDITTPPPAIATVLLDAHAVASAAGTTAAGTWKLAPAPGAGAAAGDITAWWLTLRTDRDEPPGAT